VRNGALLRERKTDVGRGWRTQLASDPVTVEDKIVEPFLPRSNPSMQSSDSRKAVVRQAIRELMDELSSYPSEPLFCKCCGERMRYIETTFSLYGTEREWKVAVPACACAKKEPQPVAREKAFVHRIGS
jgi:hypothetical protein